MTLRKLVTGVVVIAGMLPGVALADLTFVGRQDVTGQGFGNVTNVITLQQTPSESGSVTWNGTQNVINGTATNGCPANTICNGPDTGTSSDPNKTSTQTLGTAGWTSGQNVALAVNLNQTGSDQTITLQSLVMNVYSAAGSVLFTASLPSPHTFTTIAQGTGVGFFVFELTSAEAAAMNTAVFTGGNFANDRVGLSASFGTSNDGPETISIAKVSAVPEPSFYGMVAFGLIGLIAARKWTRREA